MFLDFCLLDADSYKNQRDEARRDSTDAEGRVRDYEAADAATKASSITNEKKRSTIKAIGRLMSAMTAILVIAMLGYSIYLENTTAKVVLKDSVDNATFKDETHQALRVLIAPKPVPAHVPDPSKLAKKSAPTLKSALEQS